MDATLATLTMTLTKRCSRSLVTPEEIPFAKRRAKSVNLEDTRPTETVGANNINRRPANMAVLLMSAVKMNAQEQVLAIVVKIIHITVVMTGTNVQPLTVGWSSNPTITIISLASLVNISQVVVIIVVVAVDKTPTETTVGTAIMLIILAMDALVLDLTHALVAAINL